MDPRPSSHLDLPARSGLFDEDACFGRDKIVGDSDVADFDIPAMRQTRNFGLGNQVPNSRDRCRASSISKLRVNTAGHAGFVTCGSGRS
jgi:hypothetical protein